MPARLAARQVSSLGYVFRLVIVFVFYVTVTVNRYRLPGCREANVHNLCLNCEELHGRGANSQLQNTELSVVRIEYCIRR